MNPNLLTANNGATEPDPSALVAAMRARGIRFVVYRRRGGVDIVLRPYRLVTDADRAALREQWDAVRSLVLAEEQQASASPPLATVAPSAPVARATAPRPTTNDDAWFDTRGGKRVRIARIDAEATTELLELMRRHGERNQT
jgi:hypothetical protein